MTPERLAEIRLIGEDIGWVAELLDALDASERLRAAAEADAGRWKQIARRIADDAFSDGRGALEHYADAEEAAHAAAMALRPPVTP